MVTPTGKGQGMRIINANVISDGLIHPDMCVVIDDTTIKDISPMNQLARHSDLPTLDIKGDMLCAGFIDIHTHGCAMFDTMDASEKSFDEIAKFHFQNGETTFLPTTLTASLGSITKVLDCFRRYKSAFPVNLPGIHLEGPFLSAANRGAQPERFLLTPDKDSIDFVVRNSDIIRLITIAPDLANIRPLIEACVENGIVVSGGHDAAIETEVYDAMLSGLRSVTHIFCSSSTLSRRNFERHIGITEVALSTDALYVEAIADGSHLPYPLFNLLYKCKGYERIILVSDSMRATGMPRGRYYVGEANEGTLVEVTDKVAMLPDKSKFAGSITPVRKMVEGLARNTDVPLAKIVYMATTSPARLLHFKNKGDVRKGFEAKLNVLSAQGVLLRTIADDKVFER
jgi:N-acetylglucosamine-6-phosphate deacetylase